MFYLTELGNRLKEAREAKGLSLEDLQELTKIQKRYLIGIEEGNYSMMPGKFYVRAFIKQYCEAVGLDSEEIFEQYKSEIPSVYSEELPEQLSRVQSRKTIPAGDSKVVELLPKILAAVLVIGAAVLIWVLVLNYMSNPDNDDKKDAKQSDAVDYNKSEDFNKEDNADQKQNEEKSDSSEKKNEDDTAVKDEEKEQNLAVTSSSGKNSTYELKNTDTFKLKVTSKGSPWVGIKNGEGKLLFQGTIEKDKSQEIDFTNEKEAVINIGRAYETEIYVNDEKLEYSISPTEVNTQLVTIQFTKAE
uniref:helix-turn-helix domain-containing protein n=1 Tax=Peribacillus frigoritolerans TaxID=450367 RepID=UPI0029F50E2F|nr:RodZ family helix-turn-helix domain-containing protein [Peribacillus frigoritolerans]